MYLVRRYISLIILLVILSLCACKKWDDHVALNQPSLNENLLQEINKHPELSSFSKYLKETGLDAVIASSKNYTIWAPDNKALKDYGDLSNDTAALKALLLNHISPQLMFSATVDDSIRVSMLNGKRVFFFNNNIGDATITKADIHVRNGVLNIIDKSLPPLPNIWEYILQTKDDYEQNAFITALNYTAQDPSSAVLDSINPQTGNPVYLPGTGIININSYLNAVYDISDEDSLYTYILLTNPAYEAQRDKEKPFFKSSFEAYTDSNACWNVVKDLTIKGLYLPDQLSDSLLSKFGVHVPVNKSAILETHKMSNGIVYILNNADCRLEEKIPSCVIQGENPVGFSSEDENFMGKVFYRQRSNPFTGQDFNDIYLNLGSSGANDYVDYATNNLYTTTYKVYWVALNDFTVSGQDDDAYGTDSSLHQILQIGNYSDSLFNPVFNVESEVAPDNYKEVYLGEFTNDSYNWKLAHPKSTPDGKSFRFNAATQRLRILAPAHVPSGVPYNLTVDYIKLVPVF